MSVVEGNALNQVTEDNDVRLPAPALSLRGVFATAVMPPSAIDQKELENNFEGDTRFAGLNESQLSQVLAGVDIASLGLTSLSNNRVALEQLMEKKRADDWREQAMIRSVQQQIADIKDQINTRIKDAERRIAEMRAQAEREQELANAAADKMHENQRVIDEANIISESFDPRSQRYRTREDRSRAEQFSNRHGRHVDGSRTDLEVQNNIDRIAREKVADNVQQSVSHQKHEDNANKITGAADDAQMRLDAAEANVARIDSENLTPEQRRDQLNAALEGLKPEEIFQVANAIENQATQDEVRNIGRNKQQAPNSQETNSVVAKPKTSNDVSF